MNLPAFIATPLEQILGDENGLPVLTGEPTVKTPAPSPSHGHGHDGELPPKNNGSN